jgi:hypothetical protein
MTSALKRDRTGTGPTPFGFNRAGTNVSPKRRVQTVFSIIELKTTTLDYGIPGISQAHMLLLFLMMISVSMIPYLLLYLSLRDKSGKVPVSSEASTKPFRKMIAWMHAHRHPALLHH